MLFLLDAQEAISNFFASGGVVLTLIALLTFIMWVLILERYTYCLIAFRGDLGLARQTWAERADKTSWFGESVRRQLVSELAVKIEANLRLIKVLIALCPLFGLLGTVTGMIEVFSVLSITGGGDAKSMAGGVSRATIPTMAGMVAALSGLFANIYLSQLVTQRRARVQAVLAPVH